ncbi:MAG: type II toxin-antitoxin system RelE/ParE family toxin [Cyanobacteria bacterium J06641_5]
MGQFYLTQTAVRDIEAIADYLTRQSGLERGEQFLDRIDATFARIAQFPKLGRQRDEILPGVRSLGVSGYLILYVAAGARVNILRVVSGYRNLADLFAESED